MRTISGATFLLGSLLLTIPAQAQQCTVPNTITNGQVADATEVMDNFDAVTACVDETRDNAVTHEGTPNAGEIAVFDSTTGITSGNLSGDVTTSGGTQTELSTTGVVPGTYTNATITVDDKGRVTFADSGQLGGGGGGGGGASLANRFDVAAAGDNFIDVKLDADDGYAYRVLVKGEPTADAAIGFRLSSDNGVSFYSGSSDYKSYDQGAVSAINLSARRTIESGRNTIITFTVAGMNVQATERVALVGEIFSVDTGIRNVLRAVGGHNNGLAANDFNAFRVYTTAGTMDNISVFVERVY